MPHHLLEPCASSLRAGVVNWVCAKPFLQVRFWYNASPFEDFNATDFPMHSDHLETCPRYAVVNAATEVVRKRRFRESGIVDFSRRTGQNIQ